MLIDAFHLLRRKKQNISLKLVGHNMPSRLASFEMNRLVESEKCGLASECDAESLSEAIDYLLSNRSIAEEMGFKGREAVEKRHSWKHRAEIIKRHFK